MPLQATSGAASYDAFGGGVPVSINYIEDVFSTYLYTGTGVAQTITNGIDVSTKGGLVWIKCRNVTGESHVLADSARGASRALRTNAPDAEVNDAGRVSAFTTSGFSIGTDGELNGNGNTHVSWTFRKQPKFFDVVTWTGNGNQATTTGSATNWDRTIAHSLASQPGFIIIKRTDSTGDWLASGRTVGSYSGASLYLNSTAATYGGNDQLDSFSTTTTFSPGSFRNTSSNFNYWNINGATYVAYIFAHNAGGFGLTGTDNVISCGSFTTDGSGSATVSLGYEPQWLMVKSTGIAQNWFIMDTMRGMSYSEALNLKPNTSGAEADFGPNVFVPTATGFVETAGLSASQTYIYIAIRRGPMKVPTSGTSVYGQQLNVALPTFSFPPDMVLELSRASDPTYGQWVSDRLRGSNQILQTFSTNAESSGSPFAAFNQGGKQTTWGDGWSSGYIVNGFRRAPSFFDEVCYTGTGSATTISHNLAAVPELIIVKERDSANPWRVYSAPTAATTYLALNTTAATTTSSAAWNDTTPTSSVFTVGTSTGVNGSGGNYVAYLFATCAGVSKCFSYTGNGSSQTINCGFTGGARFVLIKRTDSTGDWYVWDTARGIVSGNDPHLSLNTTASEVTTNDTIDTDSTGFVVNQVSATNVNVSSATYIGLAIA